MEVSTGQWWGTATGHRHKLWVLHPWSGQGQAGQGPWLPDQVPELVGSNLIHGGGLN